MKVWKRNLLIAYVICSIVAIVFFYVLLFDSSLFVVVKFLLTLAGLALIAGTAVALRFVVFAFMHEHATLHAGPDGTINIERSALESTARRALSHVEGITLQRVSASVIDRKGEPVIDLSVTAVPYGTESLMAMAGRIQTGAKRALEAFTDHEVRYVAVNFVEPKKKVDVKAAAAADDARAAAGYVPPRYTGAAAAEPGSAPSKKVDDSDRVAAEEPKASFWERARARVTAARTVRDEDVLETQAVVEDASTEQPTYADAAAEPAGEPAGDPASDSMGGDADSLPVEDAAAKDDVRF